MRFHECHDVNGNHIAGANKSRRSERASLPFKRSRSSSGTTVRVGESRINDNSRNVEVGLPGDCAETNIIRLECAVLELLPQSG